MLHHVCVVVPMTLLSQPPQPPPPHHPTRSMHDKIREAEACTWGSKENWQIQGGRYQHRWQRQTKEIQNDLNIQPVHVFGTAGQALPTGDFGPPLRRWGGRLPGFGFGAHRIGFGAGMQCSKPLGAEEWFRAFHTWILCLICGGIAWLILGIYGNSGW